MVIAASKQLQIKRKPSTLLIIASTSVLVLSQLANFAPVNAAPLPPNGSDSSQNVAYVFDDSLFPCGDNGCGMSDSSRGASIFTNAVTGNPLGSGNIGTYTSNDGSTVNLTNVPLSQLDNNPNALQGYDTAILYETCTIGASSNANAMSGINSFLSRGGKVMIFDADGCADSSNGMADWSHFMFPFATNSPGPQGATGSYNTVEPSSLTTGLSAGVQDGDSVGDANIFTTYNGNWYQSITATNTNNVSGIVEAYAIAPSGGLAIYSGEDVWAADDTGGHLQQVFDNMLNQQWNPAHLPGDVSASGITLSPASQSVDHYASVHVTVTVKDASGKLLKGVQVSFKTTSGHDNCDKTSTTVTNSDGQAVCNITPATGMTDTIQASYTDTSGNVHTSNPATVNNTVVCPNYDFLGARGSGESPQSNNNPDNYSFTNEYGMGSYVYDVAHDFLADDGTKKSVIFYGVQYPAVSIVPLGPRSLLNLVGADSGAHGGVAIGAYPASEYQGVKWIIGHINWRTNYMGCQQTKYIFAGYSQGAQVIGDALQALQESDGKYIENYYGLGENLSKTLRLEGLSNDSPEFGEEYSSRIAGVALFGDPRFYGETWWRSKDSSSNYGGSLGFRMAPPNALKGKIASYCHNDDPVCGLYRRTPLGGYYMDIALKSLWLPHFKYINDGQTYEAYEWLANLTGGNPQAENCAPTNGNANVLNCEW